MQEQRISFTDFVELMSKVGHITELKRACGSLRPSWKVENTDIEFDIC